MQGRHRGADIENGFADTMVGQTERAARIYTHCHVQNRELVGSLCKHRALSSEPGDDLKGGVEGRLKREGYMSTHGSAGKESPARQKTQQTQL